MENEVPCTMMMQGIEVLQEGVSETGSLARCVLVTGVALTNDAPLDPRAVQRLLTHARDVPTPARLRSQVLGADGSVTPQSAFLLCAEPRVVCLHEGLFPDEAILELVLPGRIRSLDRIRCRILRRRCGVVARGHENGLFACAEVVTSVASLIEHGTFSVALDAHPPRLRRGAISHNLAILSIAQQSETPRSTLVRS